MALPAGVNVRRARPGDASHVFALVEQLGYQPDHRGFDETFAQVVRHPEAAVFVAVEGLRVIGYLAMSQRPQIRLGGRAACIDELVVDERRRSEGLGTALLEAAIDLRARARLQARRPARRRGRARATSAASTSAHGFVEVDSALLRMDLTKSRP